MTGIRIYIEGGGDTRGQKRELRRGFQDFLQDLRKRARAKNLGWNIIVCGSRERTFGDFCTALCTHTTDVNLLLVDAEGPVSRPPWEHLKNRDKWSIEDVRDDQCHLMVQTVEAWLVADLDKLSAYYGANFHEGAIPPTEDVEAISKDDLENGMLRATRRTQKGTYNKIRHCSELLSIISPTVVRMRAKHCDRMFCMIEGFINRDTA